MEHRPPLFFVHVMKTAGGTFRRHVLRSQPWEHIYPQKRRDPNEAYHKLALLRALPPERHREIRIYMGHFPYAATSLVPGPVTTLTVLRDPVERTISYLKRRKQVREPHRSLEEIYDDPFLFPAFVREHQVKMFALTPADPLGSHLDALEIDDARFEVARANLEAVDVLGFADRFDDFLAEVVARFGWTLNPQVRDSHVSDPIEVPAALRERIAAENPYDQAFWHHAQELAAARAAAPAAGPAEASTGG